MGGGDTARDLFGAPSDGRRPTVRLTGAGAVPPKPMRATSALDRSGTAIVLAFVVQTLKMRRAALESNV